MSEVTIEVPCRTVSEANNREHFRVKAKRGQQQTLAVHAFWPSGWSCGPTFPPPYLVTLTRIGKRVLDDDNLSSSFKKIRDVVAGILGVDDGDRAAVLWKYRQEIGKDYGVRIHIKSRRRSAPKGRTTTGAA